MPEGIRKGYFKVKILELLLFLSAFPIQAAQPQHGYSLSQVQLAEQIGAYLLENTERRLTVAELSRYFGASATLINSSFRGVYGMSPAAFLRAQKMHGAARLLRRTDRTVLDIAGQFGYDNGSKFAKAFRDVIGVSPNAYENTKTGSYLVRTTGTAQLRIRCQGSQHVTRHIHLRNHGDVSVGSILHDFACFLLGIIT